MRIKEIAAVRPSWGSPRIHVLLRREGWLVNHKRTERLYRLEGLNLRRNRPRRRKSVVTRGPSVAATRKDERWSMDFMHDQLQDGRRLRVLTVVDQYTREALATEARGSFSAHDVIDVLNRLSRSHRKPAVIQVDNGTEFASRALDAWAHREDVRLDFSRPGNRVRPHSALGYRPPAPEAIAAGPPSASLRAVQQRLPIRMTTA
jgi:putative transposase